MADSDIIKISEIDFKKQLFDMHARGYIDGYKDVKIAMIDSLTAFKAIQGDNPISIDDMMGLVEKINSKF